MAIIDKPSDYFNTKLYSGNSTDDTSITGVGFQPDWLWIKERTNTSGHQLQDVVRGATKQLFSNDTQAEATNTTKVKSFDSDGFTLGTSGSVNVSGDTYVAWNWKAGGSASSNSNGSITSSVSANTDAGFSIVSYTGNGTDGATVGHGLTSPKLVLIKDRDNATPWLMYGYPNHPAFPNDGSLIKLNETSAMVTDDSSTELSIGSSTVTFVDAGSAINGSSTNFIMYCFQEKQGFSKFGSYTGNGNADGTFVYTGFKPAWLMVKSTGSGGWLINDVKRSPHNITGLTLYADSTASEESYTGGASEWDFLSNGFKNRDAGSAQNTSGTSYIYMAFAENPFVASNFNAATAR